MRYSKNNKLNKVLTSIENDLREYLGISEIKRYYNEFENYSDYNIVEYGNLLIYYDDIYKFYRDCGYKSLDKLSTFKIWELYKRQVGYMVRQILAN